MTGFLARKSLQYFLVILLQLEEQSDRLGILDPPETEPAILYLPLEEEK
jgi:hypothetical protein